MAVNKNALIRYQVLDKCFRNPGRMFFLEDLLEECNEALIELDPNSTGIQRRQLYDDLTFMQSEKGWSVPLEKYRYGRKVYYRYSDLNFSINNQPLNDSELAQIKSAVQVISRFSGTPEFEWVNEMIPMLESKFGLIEQKGQTITFQSNVDLKGLDFITPIFNAIINERVVSVKYKDFKSVEPYDIIFHPYHLRQFNNRWFVFGLNEEYAVETWNLALDRIISINETTSKYQNCNIEWEDYFYDIVGVTKPPDSKVQEIKFLFSQDISNYVTTKPMHPTQKSSYTEQGLEVSIKVIPNYELESLILSFGEKVKVLSPVSFVDRIQNRMQDAVNNY